MTMGQIEWHRDPAWPVWRSRAFLAGGWQLLVYDDGNWAVTCMASHGAHEAKAGGVEPTADRAMRRAIAVHAALLTVQATLMESYE